MNKNIDVGFIVKAKVVNMCENKRGVRRRRVIKDMVVCVQAFVGNNNFLIKFEGGQKRDISASFISCLLSKDEVCQEVDDTIYDLPKILQGEILSIDGDPVCEGHDILEKGFYLSIFYCSCFIEDI